MCCIVLVGGLYLDWSLPKDYFTVEPKLQELSLEGSIISSPISTAIALGLPVEVIMWLFSNALPRIANLV